jgi:hypothetical protein
VLQIYCGADSEVFRATFQKGDGPELIKGGGVVLFGLGLPELIVILVILMVLFGVGKLPQIGEGQGYPGFQGRNRFRRQTLG